MTHPHPLLARLAKAGMVAAVVAGMAAAGATLLTAGPAWAWYGPRQLAAWQAVATARVAWAVGSEQVEDAATVVVGPAGWLLAAGLLRLAATGRLTLGGAGGRVRAGRWLAVVGMVVGLADGGLATLRWINPRVSNWTEAVYHVGDRVRLAVADGRAYRLQAERVPGDAGWAVGYSPNTGPATPAGRTALALCAETHALFAGVRAAGLLFFLSGVVYCLGSPDPDAET